MVALKIKEIRAMSKDELLSKLDELKKELIKLNTKRSTVSDNKTGGQIRLVKKTIARILTVLNSKGGETKP